jgi:hypothetical protein
MPQEGIRIQGLNRLIDRFTTMGRDVVTEALLGDIASYVIASIQARTSKGIDVEGSAFAPYTPAYRAFRERAGRPVNKVNLFFTGTMMNSMTFDASRSEVEIFFSNTTDPNDVASPLKAFALNESRRFFAVSRDEQDEIEDIIREHLNELLRGQRG